MSYTGSSRRSTSSLLLALAAGVAVLVLAACGGSDDGDTAAPVAPSESVETEATDFEAELQAASDRAEQAVEDAIAPLLGENTGGPPRLGLLAEALPAVSAAIAAYVVEVEALEVPEGFRADQARHVSGLRELAANVDEVIAAAAATDQEQVDALLREGDSLIRNLAADLSPEYAELAFIVPAQLGGPNVFVGLSPEESEYLDEAAAAQAEFASRASKFSAAISRQYTSTEALLNALYEAGAGEAWAAVHNVAVTIEPPPRFEGDHERWLVILEELVQIDRLIGEAARDGDIVGFEVNNHLLALAQGDASPDLSPEFATTLGLPTQADLDAQSAIAATQYGQELFEALGTFALPPEGAYVFFQTTPDDAVLETIPQLAPEFIARIESTRAMVDALSPPEEYANDQARILEYFDELAANQEAILAAAQSGDIEAVRTGIDAARDRYCAAAAELSDDVRPAAIYFGPPGESPPPFCPS